MSCRTRSCHNDLALRFAKTVSLPHENCKVYRSGPLSLFSIFAKCCGGATHQQTSSSRDTLNKTRFNKVLEKDEFVKARNRDLLANACEKNSEQSIGSYVFTNRRWRDPADPADCAALIAGYRELVTRYHDCGYVFAREDAFLHNVWTASVDAERRRREEEISISKLSTCSQSECSGSSARCPSPQSVSASRSGSFSPAILAPARCGSKRKSPDQTEPEPACGPQQPPAHFLFLPAPDLEIGPLACESIVSGMPSMLAAKDSSMQKRMSCWSQWEAAALEATTAAMLEDDPVEMVKALEFDQDFFNDLLKMSSVDDRRHARQGQPPL